VCIIPHGRRFDYPTPHAVTQYLSSKLAAQPSTSPLEIATAAALPLPVRGLGPGLEVPARATVGVLSTVMWPLQGAESSNATAPCVALPTDDTIQRIPYSRWDPDTSTFAPPDTALSVSATRFGAFLDRVEQFDTAAFGMSMAEAVATDPQHRILLAAAGQLLAAPGMFVDAASRSNTGVYVGISWTEYARLSTACGQPLTATTAQGAVLSVACGRCVHLQTAQHSSNSSSTTKGIL
jgi:Beta-ketoacyl synthase, N-terminal domain